MTNIAQIGWSNFLDCPPLVNASLDEFSSSLLVNTSIQSIQEQVEYFTFPNQPLCANADPDYLAHLNTPILARDLDLIRNISGFDTLDFIGFSDGSMVGVTYAALFPDRVGKMVLDGIFDEIVQSTNLL